MIQTEHVFSVDPPYGHGHDHPGSSKMEVSRATSRYPKYPQIIHFWGFSLKPSSRAISRDFPWNKPAFFGVPPWLWKPKKAMAIFSGERPGERPCQGQGVFVVGVVGGWLWYVVMPWYDGNEYDIYWDVSHGI